MYLFSFGNQPKRSYDGDIAKPLASKNALKPVPSRANLTKLSDCVIVGLVATTEVPRARKRGAQLARARLTSAHRTLRGLYGEALAVLEDALRPPTDITERARTARWVIEMIDGKPRQALVGDPDAPPLLAAVVRIIEVAAPPGSQQLTQGQVVDSPQVREVGSPPIALPFEAGPALQMPQDGSRRAKGASLSVSPNPDTPQGAEGWVGLHERLQKEARGKA